MKQSIKNRRERKICVIVETVDNPKGLAFVMHGLGGYKEQPHIRSFIESFLEENFNVISFDTTNTFGESDGLYEDATVTNYYEDLEVVIEWSKKQEFYSEPFFLAGHSLGGICITLYAQKKPNKIKGLAPISTVVSGKLSLKTPKSSEWKKWKETGWNIKESSSKPVFIKKIEMVAL
ncbi:MAG: lysophospholipase [Nanoarchaeota archaeon]|nr:lysophospholipase [Nanoarchaeota archaeon]MBU1854622.1 lysophospholipase [Nanoarchaeota archaeon]